MGKFIIELEDGQPWRQGKYGAGEPKADAAVRMFQLAKKAILEHISPPTSARAAKPAPPPPPAPEPVAPAASFFKRGPGRPRKNP